MSSRLSKIRSVHTYVMLRTVYFGWICILKWNMLNGIWIRNIEIGSWNMEHGTRKTEHEFEWWTMDYNVYMGFMTLILRFTLRISWLTVAFCLFMSLKLSSCCCNYESNMPMTFVMCVVTLHYYINSLISTA